MKVGEHGWPDWAGQIVVLVAGGETAAKTDLAIVRGRAKVAAINNSWRLCPWADVLYACDAAWWRLYDGAPHFEGIKISYGQEVCLAYPDVRKVNVQGQSSGLNMEPVGVISDGGERGTGGNSGWQLMHLVLQWGARRIALVGYDMSGGHWHGRHPQGLSNPSQGLMTKWARVFDETAADVKQLGAMIVNCSPASLITAYPKMALPEAIEWLEVTPIETNS